MTQAATTGAARRRLSLARKFTLAFIGLVTFVLLSNGAVNLWLSYTQGKAVAVRLQQEKAQAAAERISQFVADIEQQVGWTTRAEWAQVPLEQRRYDFIRLMRQAPAIAELTQIDSKGREQMRLSRLEPDVLASGADLSGDLRFLKAVTEGAYYGPVYFRRGSEPHVSMSFAHVGRSPGVTSAEVNLKLVWDIVNSIRVGEKGYAYITNARGKLVAHPDMSLVLRETDMSQNAQFTKALTEGGSKAPAGAPVSGTDFDGMAVLTAHASVPRVNWIVFVRSPLREALAPVFASLEQTAMLLGLGFLLALVSGSWLARRMTVPIQRLQTGAERLGSGDLTQRIDIKTGDEIEALADRFNGMAARLQESYAELEGRVGRRTADLAVSLQQQTALAEGLKVISRSAFDLKTVLNILISSAQELCKASQGVIYLLDGDILRATAQSGISPEFQQFITDHPIKPSRSTFVGRTALTHEVVHLPDVLDDPEYYYFNAPKLGQFRSALGVPLMRDGLLVGVLAFSRPEPRAFAGREIELVKTFADQAVIAIENARLFEKVEARTQALSVALQQQTATADVLKVISRSAFDINSVLTTLISSAARLCEANQGAILVRDGAVYRIKVTFGMTPEFRKFMQDSPVEPGNNSFAARTALLEAVVNIPDALADPDYSFGPGPERARYRAGLGVPLMRDGAIVGLFVLARPEPVAFTERQVELVQSFADQAVIALENVRLYDEAGARTRELAEALKYQTVTADVLKIISRSTFELQAVLDVLITEAVRHCEADTGTVFRQFGDGYRRVAAIGHSPDYSQYMSGPGRVIPLGRQTLVGRTALEGHTVQILDAMNDPEYEFGEAREIGGYRTMLGVPLSTQAGFPIGVISLTRRRVEAFSDQQIMLARTFADQAVIAMENARLVQELRDQSDALAHSYNDLRLAQDRLVQTEKLASLGQLTAGIAHEIKNPLNFVNNFADVSRELIDEMRAAMAHPQALSDPAVKQEIDDLAQTLKDNLAKVVQHGRRADSIVKNMLLHSRDGSSERRLIDVNASVEESLNLAYHGARAERPGFNINLEKQLDQSAGTVELFPQEFMRVMLNLISNGFYAAHQRKKDGKEPGFEPTLKISTVRKDAEVVIKVRDNGNGIPDAVRAKMFTPFFTTKPAGEGTGLGLSLSYDIIVKQHGGKLEVETAAGEYTEFTITFPSLPVRAGGAP